MADRAFRPLAFSRSRTPLPLIVLFAVLLALQAVTSAMRPPPRPVSSSLPAPWPAPVWKGLSLGEPSLAAQLVVLYLQSYDDQPGRELGFRDLDYAQLTAWLDGALALDPASHYPLLLAAQIYSQVNDPARVRLMCDFVHRAFLADPDRRWRWLAHCSIAARHRLGDLRLALRYADDIAVHAGNAPGWARQMRIFLLEDVGEREQAKILLGGLLASGEVTDPAEARFLTARLAELDKPKDADRTSR